MTTISLAFGSAIALIVLGFVLRRIGVLNADHGRAMNTVVLYVTLPALIIRNVSTIDIEPSLLLLAAICVGWSALVLVPAFLVFRRYPSDQRGLMIIGSIGYNIGLFAFPIIERIFGAQGVQYLAAFDIGSAITNFSIAFVIAGLLSPRESERRGITVSRVLQLPLRSVPLLSYLVAIVIAASGATIPAALDGFLATVSGANQVLIFLSVGVFLEFRLPASIRRGLGWSLGFRYVGGLVAGGVLALVLPFPVAYRLILAVALILPASVALLPYAVRFGYREETASALINLTIVISVPLMWLMIARFSPA